MYLTRSLNVKWLSRKDRHMHIFYSANLQGRVMFLHHILCHQLFWMCDKVFEESFLTSLLCLSWEFRDTRLVDEHDGRVNTRFSFLITLSKLSTNPVTSFSWSD